MPFTPASVVKQVLKKRDQINDLNVIKEMTRLLFNLALRDKEAAALLFKEPNRFVACLPQVIPKEQLLQFAKAHHGNLVKQVIHVAAINKELAREMLQANIQRHHADQQFNVLLQQIQSHRQEPVHPPVKPLNGRTYLAVKHNPLVQEKNGVDGVMHENEFVPMVSRDTRNFNQKLCSAGSSAKREVILLDPNDPTLKALYNLLKAQLPITSDPQQILETVKTLTRSCLTGSKPEAFINECLRDGKRIIPLSDFIMQRQGVCRHHTLLNAYFLSRLVQDGLLKGEVIHHRQDFREGAHTWNVFRGQNGKTYSLDSLWNDVTCITDNPGAINSLYRQDVETEINNMHFQQAPEARLPQVPEVQPKQEPFLAFDIRAFKKQIRAELNVAEKIMQIKHVIENTQFTVGDYLLWKGGLMLQLADGSEKRVPHRVFDIYKLIKKNESHLSDPAIAQKLWADIQAHADNALKNPRTGRHEDTTAFYSDIVNNKIVADEPVNNAQREIRFIL